MTGGISLLLAGGPLTTQPILINPGTVFLIEIYLIFTAKLNFCYKYNVGKRFDLKKAILVGKANF
jgi:hypothetical protein